MSKFRNLDKKKKIILISSIITFIILGIISATFAYFAWVGEESSVSVTVIGGTGECAVKEDNVVFLEPTETREGGRIVKFTAKQLLGENAYITWSMKINKTNGLNDKTFRYEMINTTTGASYGSGDFADINDGSVITFSNDTESLSINTEYEFTLYLWIDGTIGNNPLSMAGQNLDFDMACTMFDDLSAHKLTDFTYILGSEVSTVSELTSCYYGFYNEIEECVEESRSIVPISIEPDEILLVRYNGKSSNVSIPDTYVVDGVTYNVVLLSSTRSYFFSDESFITGVFYGNKNIKNVIFGNNVKFVSSETTEDGEYDEELDLAVPSYNFDENSADYIFSNCTGLMNAPVIPSSVTSMSSSFEGCTNLVYVPVIPSSVTSMYSTFSGCTSLVNAPEIPSSVTSLNSTFSGCTSLVNAPEIPSSVTSMYSTFSGCTSLVNAPEIPSSVTDLSYTYNGCTSLTGIVKINSNSVTYMSYLFNNTSKPITVVVPANSTTYTNISKLSSSNGMPSNVTLSVDINGNISDMIPRIGDFTYILGSDVSTVDEVSGINRISYEEDTLEYEVAYEYGTNITIPVAPINLASNEILLISYNGDSTSFYVPDTYTINGNIYDVVVLQNAYETIFDIIEVKIGDLYFFNGDQNSVKYGSNVDILQSGVGYTEIYNEEEETLDFANFEILIKNGETIYSNYY